MEQGYDKKSVFGGCVNSRDGEWYSSKAMWPHFSPCSVSATFTEERILRDKKILGIVPCQATGTIQPIQAPNPLLILH